MPQEKKYSSPAIAETMVKNYSSTAKSIKVDMLHEEEITQFIQLVEDAHEAASESTLVF